MRDIKISYFWLQRKVINKKKFKRFLLEKEEKDKD